MIPKDFSRYPDFPTKMGDFENATAYGEAVLTYWAEWRKVKAKDRHVRHRASRRKAKAEAKQSKVNVERGSSMRSRATKSSFGGQTSKNPFVQCQTGNEGQAPSRGNRGGFGQGRAPYRGNRGGFGVRPKPPMSREKDPRSG